MARFLAGAAACFLLLTGAFLLWQSRAQGPGLPGAPAPRAAGAPFFSAGQPLEAPEASARTREEKRVSRADKNKDGKIDTGEYFAARRKFFDKLDVDHNGGLSFQEYAAKAIEKFRGADGDHNSWLTAAEFATTAAPAPKHKTCSCVSAPAAESNSSDD